MRALRLLATLLLVALSTGLYSCGDDIERSPITSITPDNEGGSKEDPFKDYLGEDYSNITCQSLDFRLGDTVTISGLKSKHLWFAYFDKSSKKKMFEWVDVEETDTIQQLHKVMENMSKLSLKELGLFITRRPVLVILYNLAILVKQLEDIKQSSPVIVRLNELLFKQEIMGITCPMIGTKSQF